ncbi:protein-arginine deiminase domain-containing protein [Streptomyces tuirus]|uniref:Protein-arginine deiminase domain-containing protein n=1 Tax=Streptomyces tuirus TaxID=68278 RepID=A0A941J1P3_9ACTN|nr:protein-arginine deiminase domain-containing protein [Streptomyces tuirus]
MASRPTPHVNRGLDVRKSHAGRLVVAFTATGAVLAPTSLAQAAEPFRIDLRADVNRDGRVDTTGYTDAVGEDTWSIRRGAVYLPNIDDDSKRCRATGPDGKPLSDAKLVGCNDALDTKVNGTTDAADLARVRSVPVKALPSDAKGSITVTTGAAHTRVFLKRSGGWTPVTSQTRLTAKELRSGVELGIEATDVIRDSTDWDGRAVIRFTVTSSAGTRSDSVTLRVAPLLTHHHLQKAQQVLVYKDSIDDDFGDAQRAFVKDLEKEVRRAGVTKPLVTFDKYQDMWAQDFVEPAYVSMTGPGGKRQAMRVMLRSAQDREAGRELYERLRGPDIGVVQAKGPDMKAWETLNSMGNLETIPPYTHRGRSFPAGRVIMGERTGSGVRPSQEIRTLLKSQGLQDPLLLDTSWLAVGHVDEFVQFLPADTPRGWRLGVADPEAGLRLLRDAQRDGHGATRMFSVPGEGNDVPRETIDQALASPHLVADNTMAARRINAALAVLKRETGITDAEIVRVPSLFTRPSEEEEESGTGTPTLQRLGGSVAREMTGEHGQQKLLARDPNAAEPTVETSAYIPGAVNGIVIAPDRYIAPQQWGPVIGGKDIFTEAVTAAYTKAGMKVSYLDGWLYHIGMGEVHCGTNTLRDASAAWWKA